MGLILDTADAAYATEEQVRAVPCPPPRGRWQPISHGDFIDAVKTATRNQGLKITSSTYGLQRGVQIDDNPADNTKMFCYFTTKETRPGKTHLNSVRPLIGGRNSIDQTLASAIAFGGVVTVCSNLILTGGVVLKRKHTVNQQTGIGVKSVLPEMLSEALGEYGQQQKSQRQFVRRLQEHPLDDLGAHNMMVEAVVDKVISGSNLLNVVELWQQPPHVEFEGRNAWSLYNSFTEHMKGYTRLNLITGADRHARLTSLFNRVLFEGSHPSLVDETNGKEKSKIVPVKRKVLRKRLTRGDAGSAGTKRTRRTRR